MPEVVYPTPDANGKSRTWDDVFPIWKLNAENTEWRVINNILEAIAMNNRFGEKTADEMRQHLLDNALNSVSGYLEENESKLRELPNPESGSYGLLNKEDITEAHQKILDERITDWQTYGKYAFYIIRIFENLGGAYREHKSA
jgi:vacuolar-type H+-ATPase subunit E/Vma4